MTMANRNLNNIIQPLVKREMESYERTHPDLTEEEKAGIRVFITSMYLSASVRLREQQFQLTNISKIILN